MRDVDPDTLMLAAGVVISLVAAIELRAQWQSTHHERDPRPDP